METLVMMAASEGSSTNSAITNALSTWMSGIQSDALSMITTATPYALAIVGAILVVTIGIKVFKKLTNKAG